MRAIQQPAVQLLEHERGRPDSGRRHGGRPAGAVPVRGRERHHRARPQLGRRFRQPLLPEPAEQQRAPILRPGTLLQF